MTLEKCYQKASSVLGEGAEQYSVVECVEAHRNYWRPKNVHTVLLAESHVYTPAADCIEMKPLLRISNEPANVPSHFARFVYCRGYGEADYVGSSLARNPGTWQYWKIFSSCTTQPSSESFNQILKKTNIDPTARLVAKTDLLLRLRELGVWLIDASILALYTPGGGKPQYKTRKQILECCWDNYICDQIKAANPKSIIVIGGEVMKTLHSRLAAINKSGIDLYPVPQPQKRMKSDEIRNVHQTYFDVCQKAHSAPKQMAAIKYMPQHKPA
jgi:hypothetical protein